MQKTLIETVSAIGEEGLRGAVEGVNSGMIYLTHCKTFCECYNVPPPSTTIKEKFFNPL
jgi:hypothetical protein